jgi:hypothetical protein
MTADPLYIRIRGQSQGPYTREQLQVLIRRGVFGRMHEASPDGRTWSRASTIPELFAPARSIGSMQQSIVPVESAAASEDSTPWYFAREGAKIGPMTWNELLGYATNGAMHATDLVWSADMADWLPAGELADLRDRIAGSPPIPLGRQGAAAAAEGRSPADDADGQSSSARLSLILGILGWTVLPAAGGLVAVLCGHLALNEIAQTGGRLQGRSRAIAGLALGYSSLAACAIAAVVFNYLRHGD